MLMLIWSLSVQIEYLTRLSWFHEVKKLCNHHSALSKILHPQGVSPGWVTLDKKNTCYNTNGIWHNKTFLDSKCLSMFQRCALSELNHQRSSPVLPQRCAYSTAQMFSGRQENICRRGKDGISELILITEWISCVFLLLEDIRDNCKCLAIMDVEMGKVSSSYPGLTEMPDDQRCEFWDVLLFPAFHQSKGRHQSLRLQSGKGYHGNSWDAMRWCCTVYIRVNALFCILTVLLWTFRHVYWINPIVIFITFL